jgi:hypothetical protein
MSGAGASVPLARCPMRLSHGVPVSSLTHSSSSSIHAAAVERSVAVPYNVVPKTASGRPAARQMGLEGAPTHGRRAVRGPSGRP